LRAITTVVSPFFAKKAWNGQPELTRLVFCDGCGFRFFDHGLSSEEADRYYSDYGSEAYFTARNEVELFYTRKAYEGDRKWAVSAGRKIALLRALEQAGAPHAFSAALDFGGGTGHMLVSIEATKKAVFDLSKEATEVGVTSIGSREEIGNSWDLVLNCQVLEHVHEPFHQIQEITRIMSNGGWLYTEVPDQRWTDLSGLGFVRDAWLCWLLKRPKALLAADLFSTAFRVKAGFVPPFGFVPMREHINFFTVEALKALLTRARLNVRWSGKNLENCICAVATKEQ
jgi:SAM-dependent methyltransferase